MISDNQKNLEARELFPGLVWLKMLISQRRVQLFSWRISMPILSQTAAGFCQAWRKVLVASLRKSLPSLALSLLTKIQLMQNQQKWI